MTHTRSAHLMEKPNHHVETQRRGRKKKRTVCVYNWASSKTWPQRPQPTARASSQMVRPSRLSKLRTGGPSPAAEQKSRPFFYFLTVFLLCKTKKVLIFFFLN